MPVRFPVCLSLPGIAFLHALLDTVGELMVLQSPVRRNQQFPGRLRNETLQNQIRPEMLYIIDNQINVFISRKQVKFLRMQGILMRHARSANELKLVHLQRCERQFRQTFRLLYEIFPALSR